MSIRWRLGALASQLIVLAGGTWLATGSPWQNTLWFFSGLLAMALNHQLIEPFYPRPADTIANSIVAIFLVLAADKSVAGPGWVAAGSFFVLAGGLSLVAQLLGRAGAPWGRIGRSARALTDRATAVPIYSVVFVLALLEAYPVSDGAFWILAIAWFILATIGVVNWERAFRMDRGQGDSRVVGFVGPSLLVLESGALPRVGTPIGIESGGRRADGTVVRRVRRLRHVVGEIHIDSPNDPESFLTGAVALVPTAGDPGVVGVVDHGSTDRVLRFPALRPLAVGDAVFVEAADGELLYQITQAEISRRTEQEGAELETHCRATQLGRWDDANRRIERYPWVAAPGAAVFGHSDRAYSPLPSNQVLHLGYVIGSQIPIELDLHEASTGHVLVLGMTKMGKSTFAIRLARALAATRPVVILDQTGEYRTRHEVPVCTAATLGEPGLSLKETARGDVGPKIALDFFEKILDQMTDGEYEDGEVTGRTVVVEEAHQFIPEPAGLGFGTPGREEAYKLGTLMMQIRKYGLSVVLISQRTAVVGKSALSQCENIIAFRSVDRTGLDYLEGIMGSEAVRLLPRLEQGQAIVAGPAFNSDEPVAIQVGLPGPVNTTT